MKGYTIDTGYMGYVRGAYILFVNETEYMEYLENQCTDMFIISLTAQPTLPSTALSSIDVATATPHSSALQNDNVFCTIRLKMNVSAHQQQNKLYPTIIKPIIINILIKTSGRIRARNIPNAKKMSANPITLFMNNSPMAALVTISYAGKILLIQLYLNSECP